MFFFSCVGRRVENEREREKEKLADGDLIIFFYPKLKTIFDIYKIQIDTFSSQILLSLSLSLFIIYRQKKILDRF